jgi:predicted outer membrane repeat protein
VLNSLIENNQSDYGGGIDSIGTLTLINTVVRNNRTLTHDGGGLDVGGTVTISNSQIYSNTANDNGGSGGNGGGLNIGNGGNVTINNSQIYSNIAYSHVTGFGHGGGGIYNAGTLTVTQSTLTGNSTTYTGSGGTYNAPDGGLYNFGGSATLTNVTFSGNSAISTAGGGILNYNGTTTLANVTFSSNSTTYSGGGIYNENATLTMTNVTLSGNSATFGYGGGVLSYSSAVTLTNVTFSGNLAQIGGGLYNQDSVVKLINVTFSGNSATYGYGGGIFHYGHAGKTTTLKNTIVANSSPGGNCYVDAVSVTSITSSGFNLSSDNSCTSYFNQAGDQNNKPAQLGPLANNGGFTRTHMPLPPIVNGSGPIDNASCVVSQDQRGVSRPQGVACDIGAVERKPGDFGFFLYLPLILR